MQKLFLEILGVESQPAVDDYLSLIQTVQDINQIWMIIGLIITFVVEEKNEVEFRGKRMHLKKTEKESSFLI